MHLGAAMLAHRPCWHASMQPQQLAYWLLLLFVEALKSWSNAVVAWQIAMPLSSAEAPTSARPRVAPLPSLPACRLSTEMTWSGPGPRTRGILGRDLPTPSPSMTQASPGWWGRAALVIPVANPVACNPALY